IYNNIRYPDEMRWNHVSICLINGGGVRASIDERTSNGTITLEDLISVLPFGGTFDLIEIKGSTMKAAFEHSVHRYGSGTGEFLQVSGMFPTLCVICTYVNKSQSSFGDQYT
ncbi:hypothetical protein FKM82_027401, partial [Ascaphus truei]